jgi:hypothetical protein
MRAWLESIAGPEYASAMIWTLGALILLLVILVVVRIVRGLTFGTFVAGGRNRKTRLAVMDAAAVDSHRRLVLVRRDDVEHLILIGGPTDVVVEQNIRLQTPARRTLSTDQRERLGTDEHAPRQSPESLKPPAAPADIPVEPAAARRPETPASTATTPPPPKPAYQPRPMANPEPIKPAAATVSPLRPAAAPTSGPAGKGNDLDDALLKELEVTLNERAPAGSGSTAPKKPDDDMSKLLGDVTPQRDK